MDVLPSGDTRSRYCARQAELIRALMAGGEPPGGFDPARMQALRHSLMRKRGRTVARAWPALAHALGRGFAPRFAGYARWTPPSNEADAILDGLAFAASLGLEKLDDAARLELLQARARFVIRAGRARRRMLPFLGAVRSTNRGSCLVVVSLPHVDPLAIVFPSSVKHVFGRHLSVS